MRHLKIYESIGEEKMRGYIFWVRYIDSNDSDINSSFFMPVVAKNFYEASKLFIGSENGEFSDDDEDYIGDEEEDLVNEDDSPILTAEGVFNDFSQYAVESPEVYDTELWTGLIPRVNKPTNRNNYIHITATNPFQIIKDLDRHFTNVKEIMEKFPMGLDQNKWSEILLGDEDEMVSYFKDHPLDIHLLDDQPEVKKRVIAKSGMKDLSKLGRNKKNGLI